MWFCKVRLVGLAVPAWSVGIGVGVVRYVDLGVGLACCMLLQLAAFSSSNMYSGWNLKCQ